MDPGNRRAVLAAFFANLGIAIAKFVGWAATGAASMLAEAVHSVADTGNQALLLWGGAAAARAPTPAHPFGYGRERYFWSFIVALVIFALGGVFAIVEGAGKLRHPHELSNPIWAVGILALGVILEGFSFRTAVRVSRKAKGRASWWDFVRRTKNPELPVVLLEDLGALLGLLLALLAVLLAMVTGEPRFDALGSMAIGVLLCVIAAVLAVEMRSLLLGEAATVDHQERIRASLLGAEAVRHVIHLRTQHLGPDELLVAAKLEFDSSLSIEGLSREIDAAEQRVRDAVPLRCVIYLEPDVFVSRAATGS